MSDTLLMLLEMIEEVLGEQSLKEAYDVPIFKVEDLENIEDEGRREKISKLFAYAIKLGIKDPLAYQASNGKVKIRNVDDKLLKQKIKQFAKKEIGLSVGFGQGSVGKSKKKLTRVSERFEGNLIIALNGQMTPGYTEKDYLPHKEYQTKAESVIQSIGKDNIVGQNFYKVPDGKATSLYKYFNPKTRGTSKADIAAKDDGSPTQISVKKENASLLSSEVSETCAILAAISGFKPDGTTENPITELIGSLQKSLSAANLKKKTSAEKRQIFDKAIVEVYEYFYANSGDNEFKINFIIEAMTGMKRFVGNEQKALQLLKWNDNGKGSYYPSIVEWSKQNTNLVTFDVRWRGENRSAGARLDPWVTSTLSNRNVFRRLYEEHGLSQTINEREQPGRYDYDIQKQFVPPQSPAEPTNITTPSAGELITSLLDFIKATIDEVLPTGEGIVVRVANLQPKGET